MNFTSKVYLPDSESRIDHLRKIIAGRPVAILALGPSINELEKRIYELKNVDICYFCLNNFPVHETHILKKIDKHASVIMYSAPEGMKEFIGPIANFLDRDEDNMFISTFWRDAFGLLGSDFNLNQFIREYNNKLIFFSLSHSLSYRQLPDNNNPLHFNRGNSLQILIQLAVIGKASKIVLFGADGYCEENSDISYYRPDEYQCTSRKNLIWDTKIFNTIVPISIKNVYKTYSLDPIEILNCSEKSFLTPFPLISYDNAFEYLTTGKTFNQESDLRFPKVSVISLFLNDLNFLKETIENIANQSYTNYEHIVIYIEDNIKIQDIQQKFPRVRWFPEKNIDYIHALKKGISMAKGDYIFQYRFGEDHLDAILDDDWICRCVEILEGDPDISLVCGLSEDLYYKGSIGRMAMSHYSDIPPAYAKNYVYYWLKRKTIFPERNACIRKKIFEACFPFSDVTIIDECKAWIAFNYCFNVSGYQPSFISVIADYHHIQNNMKNQRTDPKMQTWMKEYYENIENYKKQLFEGKLDHHYRDSSDKLSLNGFNRTFYLYFTITRNVNAILPSKLFINFEKYLQYWVVYRWTILPLGVNRCWHRLIKEPCAAMRSYFHKKMKRKTLDDT